MGAPSLVPLPALARLWPIPHPCPNNPLLDYALRLAPRIPWPCVHRDLHTFRSEEWPYLEVEWGRTEPAYAGWSGHMHVLRAPQVLLGAGWERKGLPNGLYLHMCSCLDLTNIWHGPALAYYLSYWRVQYFKKGTWTGVLTFKVGQISHSF